MGCIIILPVIFIACSIISLPFHAVSNIGSTAHGVIDKTLNADNAIYNYEWFKQQYEDIQAMERKALIAEEAVLNFESIAGERSTWTFEDKTEAARLRSVAQGLRTSAEDMIATYNARSKMANRNIFQEGVLPGMLEISTSLLR